MASVLDVFGIDPEEVRAALEEAALEAGESPINAAMAALDGAMELATMPAPPVQWFRVDGDA